MLIPSPFLLIDLSQVPFVYICKRACTLLGIALILRVLTYTVTLVRRGAVFCLLMLVGRRLVASRRITPNAQQ